jgi:hypothetical protein
MNRLKKRICNAKIQRTANLISSKAEVTITNTHTDKTGKIELPTKTLESDIENAVGDNWFWSDIEIEDVDSDFLSGEIKDYDIEELNKLLLEVDSLNEEELKALTYILDHSTEYYMPLDEAIKKAYDKVSNN